MLGYPPTPPPPRGAWRLTARPTDPQGLGQPGLPPPPRTCFSFHSDGGGGTPPPWTPPPPLDPLPPSPLSSSAAENLGFGNFFW